MTALDMALLDTLRFLVMISSNSVSANCGVGAAGAAAGGGWSCLQTKKRTNILLPLLPQQRIILRTSSMFFRDGSCSQQKSKNIKTSKSFKLVFLKSWFIQQPASLLNNYTSFLNTQCLLNLYIKKIILDLLFKDIWLCKSVAAYLSYKVGLTLFSSRSAEFKHTSLIAYNSSKLLISRFAISTNQKNHLHRLFLGFVGARHV